MEVWVFLSSNPHRMTMRLALALLLAAAPLAAQQPAIPAVDSIFANVSKDGSPGCALGVYRDGRIFYSRGYGLANLELNVPITPASVFDIGSTSKQFTAASLVLLQQDGKLSLDDDIRKWIPELPSYGKAITIRHILHHTSGIRDYIGLMVLAGADIDDVTSEQEALDIIVRQKALNFPTGSEYLYSNSGFFLAGVIVKRASGKSLRQFATERIFQPLGMSHTWFRDTHVEWVPNRTTAYSPADSGGFVIDMSNWEQVGDGAVITTVEDLLKWDNNFYDPKVGGQAMVDELQSTVPLTSGKPNDYALGLVRGTYRGAPSVSHGGSWGGYRAELFRIPSLHFSAAVLCNVPTGSPGVAARKVADVLVGDRLGPITFTAKPETGSPDSAPASFPLTHAARREYAGKYYGEEINTTITLSVAGDTLKFERPNAPALVMAPLERDHFTVDDFSVRFQRQGGRITGFQLDMGRTRALHFSRTGR